MAGGPGLAFETWVSFRQMRLTLITIELCDSKALRQLTSLQTYNHSASRGPTYPRERDLGHPAIYAPTLWPAGPPLSGCS
jgi:hypothetical protein